MRREGAPCGSVIRFAALHLRIGLRPWWSFVVLTWWSLRWKTAAELRFFIQKYAALRLLQKWIEIKDNSRQLGRQFRSIRVLFRMLWVNDTPCVSLSLRVIYIHISKLRFYSWLLNPSYLLEVATITHDILNKMPRWVGLRILRCHIK